MKYGILNSGFKKIAATLDELSEDNFDNTEEDGSRLADYLPETVEDLQDYLTEKYGVIVYLGNHPGGMVLHRISVPEDIQNSGIGSAIMTEIIQFADDNSLSIGLTPDDVYGANMGRLEQFYRGFGFVPNKGRNKDYSYMESWVRPV